MSTQDKAAGPALTNKQIKYLRGRGHGLSALVLVGKEGINENVLEAIDSELSHHELIKVKIGNNSDADKHAAAKLIPESTASTLVQLIGKTLLLFRPNLEKPKEKRIHLPNI